MSEIKTLNGYYFADVKARGDIDTLSKEKENIAIRNISGNPLFLEWMSKGDIIGSLVENGVNNISTGTPTPENPISINGVGVRQSDGTYTTTVTFAAEDGSTQTASVSKINQPVFEGETVDYLTGKVQKRTRLITMDGEEYTLNSGSQVARNGIRYNFGAQKTIAFSHFDPYYADCVVNAGNIGFVYIRTSIYNVADYGIANVDEMNAFFREQYAAGTPVQILVRVTGYEYEEVGTAGELPTGADGNLTASGTNTLTATILSSAYGEHETKINQLIKLAGCVTPEVFGAAGDGQRDDHAEIMTCIAYAVEHGIKVYMPNTYKISQTINLDTVSELEIDANKIVYTGDDVAVSLAGDHNKISIRWITSDAAGFRLTTNGKACAYNDLDLHTISSDGNCVEHVTSAQGIYQNKINFSHFYSGSDSYCIYSFSESKGFVTENTYVGGQCHNALWCVYGPFGNCKFYNLHLEDAQNGFYMLNNGCYIFGTRYAELEAGRGIVLKIVGDSAAGVFYGCSELFITAIDTSEMTTGNQTVDGHSNYTHLWRIECPISDNYEKNYTNGLWEAIGKEAIVKAGKVILLPWERRGETISATPYTVREKRIYVPDLFIVNVADCVINLDHNYCALGHNDITIDQRTEGMNAKVYDYKGNLIFDGSSQIAGVYRLMCYCDGVLNNMETSEHWTWHKMC